MNEHTDDDWVDLFAAALKAKLKQKRREGRGGWDDPKQCTISYLFAELKRHLAKGDVDMVDVGNFAMMIWARTQMKIMERISR